MAATVLHTALGEQPLAKPTSRAANPRRIQARIARKHSAEVPCTNVGVLHARRPSRGSVGPMTSKVAVLGAGAWGTALAFLLADKGDDVVLWSRRPELAEAINTSRENARYLPGVALPENLRSTHDLAEAMRGAKMTVFVVPSHGTREVARAAAPHVHDGVPIVSATKGIENDSLMFMDEVLAQELPPHAREHMAFLSGPSFAKELVNRLPTAVVIAGHDAEVCAYVMKRFHTPYMRTYGSDDVPGVECGGALKNVVAIAAGIVAGMGGSE